MLGGMRFHLRPNEIGRVKSLNLRHRFDWNLGTGLSTLVVILLINALRVPSALLNFWAEDGVVFYSDAINEDFPQRLFVDSGRGGYLNLSGKVIAEFVRMFPIQLAPLINFISVNLVYMILSLIIFNRLNQYFKIKKFLFLLIGFFFFVPIASYDSVATSINLHFFLLFTSFIIIIAKEKKNSIASHSIIFVTCLSDPLAILLIPAIALSIIIKKNLNAHLLTYASSLIIQVVFIVHLFGDSTRVVGQSSNVIKTTYLFLDRVVGSSLIPNWGFIDGQILESGGIPKILIIRLVVSCIALVLLVYLLIVARSLNSTVLKEGQNFLTGLMLLTLSIYWAVAGLFFNPEPRYAIFPSLCLVSISLISLDSIVSNLRNHRISRCLTTLSTFLFISIFAAAFQVSDIRDTNQIWSEQIAEGKIACEDERLLKVDIRIPPERNNLLLSVNCKMLR